MARHYVNFYLNPLRIFFLSILKPWDKNQQINRPFRILFNLLLKSLEDMHIVNYMQILISVIMNACMPIFLHWMKRRYYYITSYKI